MGKVLDLTDRLNNKESYQKSSIKNIVKTDGAVVDMTAAREAILNRDRRLVKRTILTEFVGAFVILPERGLMKVALYDISDNGLSFDLELNQGCFTLDEEIAMRVYLNHNTYFPFTIKITHVRAITDEAVVRHGANFVKGTINDVALHHFVKFIENVSASLKKDDGDIVVSQIS